MKPFECLLIRDTYTLKSTVGKFFFVGHDFETTHTLEDVSRGENVKIPEHTCLPPGRYRVKVTFSQRFQRMMPMIYTEDNGYEVIMNGIRFKGSRIHGGNTHLNTESCILVARNRLNDDLIQGSLEKEITDKMIELGGEGFLTIVNGRAA